MADARVIVDRLVSSVPVGFEREALLVLAAEAMREASNWLDTANAECWSALTPEEIAPSEVIVLKARSLGRA